MKRRHLTALSLLAVSQHRQLHNRETGGPDRRREHREYIARSGRTRHIREPAGCPRH